jgi:hypothetical protein
LTAAGRAFALLNMESQDQSPSEACGEKSGSEVL